MSHFQAVIITGPGFQDHDVIYTYYRLKEAGYDVDVATAGGQRHRQVRRPRAAGQARPAADRLRRPRRRATTTSSS